MHLTDEDRQELDLLPGDAFFVERSDTEKVQAFGRSIRAFEPPDVTCPEATRQIQFAMRSLTCVADFLEAYDH